MQHTPEDPRPQDQRSPRDSSRARRSAAALAALAVFGASGTTAAQAVGPQDGPTPQERPDAVDGPARTLQPGDSLWSVATANGLSVEDLMAWNDLTGDAAVMPGDTLRLTAPDTGRGDHDDSDGTDGSSPARTPAAPGADEAARVADPAAPSQDAEPEESEEASSEHRVAPGDSLWSLALRHEVSVERLLELNDLDVAAPLRVGQGLRIPAAPSSPQAPAEREAAQTERTDPAPRIRNDFPGYDYDDATLASAQGHLDALHDRPAPSREEMQRLVRLTSAEMGVDPALALAHAEQESGFDHRSVSPADAIGTMQVLPSSGEWASAMVGRDLDLLDPRDNVTAGVALIRENQRATPSLELGIASYYQGAYGVQEYGMYDDTKEYVRAVKAHLSGWDRAL